MASAVLPVAVGPAMTTRGISDSAGVSADMLGDARRAWRGARYMRQLVENVVYARGELCAEKRSADEAKRYERAYIHLAHEVGATPRADDDGGDCHDETRPL